MSTTKEKEELGRVCAARIRELTGDNPKELAYKVGLSLSAVYNYLGGRIPAADVLYNIAKAYERRMEWFLDSERLEMDKAVRNLLPLRDR